MPKTPSSYWLRCRPIVSTRVSRTSTYRLFAAIMLTVPFSLAAQSVTAVTGEAVSCGCGLSLEHVITLGDTEGPGMLVGEVREVRRNSRGVYHVLAWQDHQILRFTPEGRALKPIASKGQGPGEAIAISHFMLVADSVVTFDPRNARMTVFTPQGELARTARVSGWVFDAEHYPGKGVVINERGNNAQTFGIPLHLLDSDGTRIRSFGGQGMVRLDAGGMWQRHIDPSGSTVWAAWEDQYTIEHWSLDGERLQTLARDVEWFKPRLHAEWGGPDEPAEPAISDIKMDRSGLIRVLMQRGGPHWAERIGEPISRAFRDPIYPAYAGLGLFESVVEFLDPKSGSLVARGVFDLELFQFVDEDHLFSYTLDDEGNPTISVWRLVVESSSPPNPSSPSVGR